MTSCTVVALTTGWDDVRGAEPPGAPAGQRQARSSLAHLHDHLAVTCRANRASGLSNCPPAAQAQVSLRDSGRCVGCATNVPANVRCGLSRMKKRPLYGIVGRSVAGSDQGDVAGRRR